MGSRHGQQTIQEACVSETTVHDHGRRLDQREFRPKMAEVTFRPVRQLSEYKGKGASASREEYFAMLSRFHSRGPTYDFGSVTRIAFKYKHRGFRINVFQK